MHENYADRKLCLRHAIRRQFSDPNSFLRVDSISASRQLNNFSDNDPIQKQNVKDHFYINGQNRPIKCNKFIIFFRIA